MPARDNDSSDDDMFTSDVRSPSSIIKEGYMHKRGKHNTSWKQRWFTLEGGSLHYSKSHESKASAGSFCVTNALINETPNRASQEFAFYVQTPSRTYHLLAPNKQEFYYWITCLRSISSAHAELAFLDRTTDAIEAASRAQAHAERLWVSRLGTLHGTLHSADGLQKFGSWTHQQQFRVRRSSKYRRDLSGVAPAPLPPRAGLWLRREHEHALVRHQAEQLLPVACELLRVWTLCEDLRVLCAESERVEVARQVVEVLEGDPALRHALGVVPESTHKLSQLLQRVTGPPPPGLLIDLQRRAFARLLLVHGLWTRTSSHAAALLHVHAYEESPLSDSFCHAVKSNDPYRMRGPSTTHSMVTIMWSAGALVWGGDGGVESLDVNAVNAKSRAAHEGNADEVLVLHVDEPFWRAYEAELRDAELRKGTDTDAGAGAGAGAGATTATSGGS